MRSFETVFLQVDIRKDEDRRRHWYLPRHDNTRWLQAQGIMAQVFSLRTGRWLF
jgi:hypothetical protein